jgi:hypothetical protein
MFLLVYVLFIIYIIYIYIYIHVQGLGRSMCIIGNVRGFQEYFRLYVILGLYAVFRT